MVKFALRAKFFFTVDAHEQQISKALTRRRALRAASGQGLRYLSLHKVDFRRWRRVTIMFETKILRKTWQKPDILTFYIYYTGRKIQKKPEIWMLYRNNT